MDTDLDNYIYTLEDNPSVESNSLADTEEDELEEPIKQMINATETIQEHPLGIFSELFIIFLYA